MPGCCPIGIMSINNSKNRFVKNKLNCKKKLHRRQLPFFFFIFYHWCPPTMIWSNAMLSFIYWLKPIVTKHSVTRYGLFGSQRVCVEWLVMVIKLLLSPRLYNLFLTIGKTMKSSIKHFEEQVTGKRTHKNTRLRAPLVRNGLEKSKKLIN